MGKLGTLVEWDDARGFGFIAPQDGGSRVFVHIKTLRASRRRPLLGETLCYVEGRDERGRPRATSVSFVAKPRRRSRVGRQGKSGLMLFGFAVLLIVVGAMLFGVMPHYLAYLVLGMSAVTFFMYAVDKTAAEKGARRTPENSLHLVALLGGWPGAMIAQQGFRHKNRKGSFQFRFWVTVVINLAFIAWVLLTQPTAAFLGQPFGG